MIFLLGFIHSHRVKNYNHNKDGEMFFIKNLQLENLNFKRIDGLKKDFKWKKMNSPTFMPKNNA